MSNLFFVVCIVAIGCATAVVTEFLKSRRLTDKNRAGDETMAQLDALEERIRVLERIVTENKIDLRREIDRL
jgi:hypothetical protein